MNEFKEDILTDEIKEIRQKLQEYIIEKDITLQQAAALIGYRSPASILKFLRGKTPKPNIRRIARMKALLESRP